MGTDDEHEHDGLWVRSDVLPTGGYGVSINVGADRAWTLPPDRAMRHAAACVRRATEAQHDAALLALMTGEGVSTAAAAQLLNDVRADRVTDDSDTEPLRFQPGVSHRSGRPFLIMRLDGRPVGQLGPQALREHATAVLATIAAADLDAALLRCLTGTIGTDENRARGVIDGLSKYWPWED